MIRPHYAPLFQSACHSEKLADLQSHGARFFYTLLLTHCDSWGRTGARPRVLASKIWSMFAASAKPEDVAREVAGMLDDLERVKVIERYEVGGEVYLWIPDWEEKAGKVGRRDRRGVPTCPPCPSMQEENLSEHEYRARRKTTPGVRGTAPTPRGSSPADCGSPPATCQSTPEDSRLARASDRLGSDGLGSDRLGSAGEGSPEGGEFPAADPGPPLPAGPDVAPPRATWARYIGNHPSIDTPAVREALDRWEGHLHERNNRWMTSHQWQSSLVAWERHGPDRVVAAIEAAILAGGSKPFFDRSDPGKPPNDELAAACTRHWEDEWARTRGAGPAGTKYVLTPGDHSAVAWMLTHATTDVVQRRMTAILEDTDAWTSKNATPSLLRTRWNSYAPEALQRKPTRMPPGIDGLARLRAQQGQPGPFTANVQEAAS